jgi:arylsulfatase A-like enzyme
LLDQLEAIGQLDNTLIIYTSDHGLNCGHHGIWGKGNGTLPLNMVEESIRIPLILRHPASFAGGRQCEEFVDHLDTFQTILDVASVGVDGGDYAGISYLPLLQNQPIPHWRTAQFCEYGTVRMVRTDRYKLVSRLAPEPTELFDLQTDPREMVNLFTDPAYQALVQQLTHQLDTYFTQYEDPHYSGLRGRELPQTNFSEAWRS